MANWLSYYGNGYEAQQWTRQQRAQNVDIIAAYFYARGWTINAIAAMVGNMEGESYINPGQWQHGFPVEGGPEGVGFGLVQWTPWTKYSNWAGTDWRTNYDKQVERIQYELVNGLQWEQRHGFTETFQEFSVSTASVDTLAEMFFWCYEYGTWDSSRISNARYWYQYLIDNPPGPSPIIGGNKMKIMFYLKPKWKRSY